MKLEKATAVARTPNRGSWFVLILSLMSDLVTGLPGKDYGRIKTLRCVLRLTHRLTAILFYIGQIHTEIASTAHFFDLFKCNLLRRADGEAFYGF